MKREWLVEKRTKKGYSQEDVAVKTNISQQAISMYESGERTPRPNQAKEIGKLLGFKWTKFYEYDVLR